MPGLGTAMPPDPTTLTPWVDDGGLAGAKGACRDALGATVRAEEVLADAKAGLTAALGNLEGREA